MAIYVVDGKPRHGKTAWLVNKHIVPWMKDAANSGFKVFSNVFINVENIPFIKKWYGVEKASDCIGNIYRKEDLKDATKLLFYWRNIDEWNLMTRGNIICDEATRYFNARQWQMLSPDTEIKLQQHGKEELDIWCTTQHWSRLDASLRVLVERFFRVERVIGWRNATYLSRVSEHYLEDLERWERNPVLTELNEEGEEIPVVEHWYFTPIRLKPLYDTRQAVGTTRQMPLRHIERVCEHPNCKLHAKPKIIHI